MSVWIVKAIIQKTISYLPFSHQINFWFQKYITRGINLCDDYIVDRLVHLRNHIEYYRKYKGDEMPSNVLEIGTGWYPIIPLCYYLWGVENTYSIDIYSHVSSHNLQMAIKSIVNYYDENKLQSYVKNVNPDRLIELRKCIEGPFNREDVLKRLGIKLLIKDARNSLLPDNYFQLITSNNTFEHIHKNILIAILIEFKRILADNGIMSHYIDMSDHFCHMDKSISKYNFLKFSEKSWRLIDNNIQPQNRLRITDFRNIYRALNININQEEICHRDEQELNMIKPNACFQHIPKKDLAISHVHLVSAIKK